MNLESDNNPHTIMEKLQDAMTPGYQVTFDPEEASTAGAFEESALNASDALESVVDLLNLTEEENAHVSNG